jgi:EAL domain-containing protein (putative c-di-GMP-specific phosphodiesterase class I)/CHASE2 domain-containing sensor protein
VQPVEMLRTLNPRRSGWRLRALLLALCIGLACGIFAIGDPIENTMKVARNKLRAHPASGAIVLVAIDDRSLADLGSQPWSGKLLGQIVTRLQNAGARRIFLDADLSKGGPARSKLGLQSALDSAGGRMLLPARFSIDSFSGAKIDYLPDPALAHRAGIVNTNLWLSWDGKVWLHPYSAEVAGRDMPSLAATLADRRADAGALFPLDYAIDMRTIPMISASDVVGQRWNPASVRGKDVAIARTDFAVEHYQTPGFALVPGIMLHLLAAETLRAGVPVTLGWLGPLAIAILLAVAGLYIRRRAAAGAIICSGAFALLFGPLFFEQHLIFMSVVPSLALLTTAALARLARSLRASYERRGTTNAVSGMPNLQALRQARPAADEIVVVARIHNYAQITTALPVGDEKELVEQVVARLRFGAGAATVYQADEGIFAWIAAEPSQEALAQHLEGLHALFRSPVVISSRLIDVTITFGLDLDDGRDIAQRISSALVAADEAVQGGKRFGSFNPKRLEDADWSMSLLGRIDKAIDDQELWVAYQPQFECRFGRLIGAEALVRWTHPEKGAIYPDQFIGAAERGGRIERLTWFVLDTALAAAAQINHGGRHFTMAVNLSARLLDDPNLTPTVLAMLRKHDLAPELLTLEVTETSALGTGEDAIANFERLSDAGINLSIDDYGTGFSTLEYLRRVPAAEIKIDRSFVGMLNKSQSDRIMVNSTIQLAHSLGRKVVAEGVESEAILRELKHMQCDIIQGYHTGRPMPLDDLMTRLNQEVRDVA